MKLTTPEFENLRNFIAERSGLAIGDSKRYLIEGRLSSLVLSSGSTSFGEFHAKLSADPGSPLVDQVIDAMATNETSWFRDTAPWAILNGSLLACFCEQLAAGKKSRIRIWSAATSTGQEPYSIAISILEHLRKTNSTIEPDCFRIVGSDISPSALFVATSARYDRFAMERGLDAELRERYFEARENSWTARPELKRIVRLERRNLMDSFDDLGSFDLIFCRNVLIYFSAELRQDVITRIASRLERDGALIVGASESLRGIAAFKMKQLSGDFLYERADV